jgi:hypothetical protein
MAVEIREMVIQAKVNDVAQKAAEEPSGKKASASSSEQVVTKLSYSIKRQIIEDCVSEVMEKLNKTRQL